jgi:hypothetical protein
MAMKHPVIPAFVVLTCLAAVGTAFADDTLRCGSKIIEVGMTQSEVLGYCGAPASKTEEEMPVRSGNQVVGKTRRYEWTYTSYSTTRVLVFDQDKLVSIR